MKVKPQVTTQIAHPRVRGGLTPKGETSPFVHPCDMAWDKAHAGTDRVAPVRAALAAERTDTEEAT